ncbi:MAG: hypothetical protein ABJE95_01925 [Byssovorax sp.]
MSARSFLGAAALVATIALPLSARAEPPPSAEITLKSDVAAPRKPSFHVPEINLALGFRAMVMPSAGLDPYASDNGVLQLSLVAGPTLLQMGRVSIAALGEWNFGVRESTARNDATSLTLHRLGVGLESRFQLGSRLMLFAKLAPAAVNLRGTIMDPGISRPLVSRSWSWALDTTAGVGVVFARTGSREAPTSRFWFTGELGYGFAGQSDMIYAPEADPADPRKYGSIMLPGLRPSGALARLALLVSF